MAGHVVLVRHGETEWSRDGRHTGRTDIPLTKEGQRKATALAQPLRAWQFARWKIVPPRAPCRWRVDDLTRWPGTDPSTCGA